jgi:plasmid stability protein
MAHMTIRNLDGRMNARLRIRAAEHGRSMKDEAREILGERLGAGASPRRQHV